VKIIVVDVEECSAGNVALEGIALKSIALKSIALMWSSVALRSVALSFEVQLLMLV
jgi:hypothetical protein